MEINFGVIKKFFVLAVIAIGALLVATGCGSDSDNATDTSDSSVTTGSLSKPNFVKQVDEMCRLAKSQFESRAGVLAKQAEARGEGELQFNRQTVGNLVSKAIVPSYENMISGIRDLGAPGGDEEEVTAFLEAIQRDLANAEAHPIESFRANEGTPFVESSKQAKAYGFRGCVGTFG